MSHFKFVSTINAVEEGCTHFLVLGNRRLRLGHTGFEKGQHIEPSPLVAPGERAQGHSCRAAAQRGFPSRRSKDFRPQWDRDRLGVEEREWGCTQKAQRTKWCQAPPPLRGTTGTSQPLCGTGIRERATGDSVETQGLAGTQGTPCSSRAPHQGDVLVTDTSVLCSSVCRK